MISLLVFQTNYIGVVYLPRYNPKRTKKSKRKEAKRRYQNAKKKFYKDNKKIDWLLKFYKKRQKEDFRLQKLIKH